VKDTPLGKVQEGASSALSSLKKAGETLKVQAAAAVERVKASIPEDAGERITKRADEIGKSVTSVVESAASDLRDVRPVDPNAPREPDAIDVSDRAAGAVEPKPQDVKPIDVEQIATKVNSGVDAVGAWLKGPGGGPGTHKSGRVRVVSSSDDVVEAKDAPTTPPKREDA
jgi:hypothetical protein